MTWPLRQTCMTSWVQELSGFMGSPRRYRLRLGKGCQAASGKDRLSGQVYVHRLHFRVQLQGVLAQLPAEAAHLEAAERRRRVEDVIAVDPDRPRPKAVGQPVRLGDVARPDGGGQAVK